MQQDLLAKYCALSLASVALTCRRRSRVIGRNTASKIRVTSRGILWEETFLNLRCGKINFGRVSLVGTKRTYSQDNRRSWHCVGLWWNNLRRATLWRWRYLWIGVRYIYNILVCMLYINVYIYIYIYFIMQFSLLHFSVICFVYDLSFRVLITLKHFVFNVYLILDVSCCKYLKYKCNTKSTSVWFHYFHESLTL